MRVYCVWVYVCMCVRDRCVCVCCLYLCPARGYVSVCQRVCVCVAPSPASSAVGLGEDAVLDNDLFACNSSASEYVTASLAAPAKDAGPDIVAFKLAGLMFQQKWTDLILADAISQVWGCVCVLVRC